MVNQTQQSAGYSECPMDYPYSEDVLLFYIKDTFQTCEYRSSDHKQKTKMYVESGKYQRRENDCNETCMLCDDNSVQVALDNASGKKFLDPGGKNIEYLPHAETAYIKNLYSSHR